MSGRSARDLDDASQGRAHKPCGSTKIHQPRTRNDITSFEPAWIDTLPGNHRGTGFQPAVCHVGSLSHQTMTKQTSRKSPIVAICQFLIGAAFEHSGKLYN